MSFHYHPHIAIPTRLFRQLSHSSPALYFRYTTYLRRSIVDKLAQHLTPAPASLANDPSPKFRELLQETLSQIKHLDLTGIVSYDNKSPIGSGGYGDLFIGAYNDNSHRGVKIAVKRIRIFLRQSSDIDKLIESEIRVWSRLKHGNVLPLLGYVLEANGFPSLISEFMENGTVLSYVKSHPEADIVYLILGIAKGVSYLHDNGVVHSDLKSDNVLISDSGEPLICDFGISRMILISQTINGLAMQQISTNLKGSSRWFSPELLMPPENESAAHSKTSDVWAFGMTLYELLTKKRPYHKLKSDPQVITAIMHGKLPKEDECSVNWPSQYHNTWELCKECWLKDPQARPTMSAILQRLDSIILQSKLSDLRCRDPPRIPVVPIKIRTEHAVRPRSFSGRRRNLSSRAEHDLIPMELLSPKRESPAEVSSTQDRFSPENSGNQVPDLVVVSPAPSSDLSGLIWNSSENLPNPMAISLDHRLSCKECNQRIIGVRYQCAVCPSTTSKVYNLCSNCEPRSYFRHHSLHLFLKLPRPVDRLIESEDPILPILYSCPAGPLGGGSWDFSHPEAYLSSLRHSFAICDDCEQIITGKWYRCVYCARDLCSICEERDKHNPRHFFYVLKAPVDKKMFNEVAELDNPNGSPPVLKYQVYSL